MNLLKIKKIQANLLVYALKPMRSQCLLMNLEDKSKIKISAKIRIVKKSEKKISLSTPPSPSITAKDQVPKENTAIPMKATNSIKEIIRLE